MEDTAEFGSDRAAEKIETNHTTILNEKVATAENREKWRNKKEDQS